VANPPPVRPVVDTVTVNIIEQGPFAGAAPHQAERRDPTLHHALSSPAWLPETPAQPAPAPTPISEAEFRQLLTSAANTARRAQDALAEAEAACKRAAEHKQKWEQQVAEFFGLDNQIAVAVAGALRSGSDPGVTRSVFAERLAERSVAQAELDAAGDAITQLQSERDEAASRVNYALKAADQLAISIVAFHAETLAQEIREFQAEIIRRRRVLLGYDRLVAGSGHGLSMIVRSVLGEPTSQDLLAADAKPWKQALINLRNDPETEIEIPLPKPVLPPVPRPYSGAGPVIRMIPIRKFEPVPPEDPSPADEEPSPAT
jgi:hypothetical protein